MKPLSLITALLLTGCSAILPVSPRRVVEAQKGGEASGAGAKVASPNNAAGPTTQVAEKWEEWLPTKQEPAPVIRVDPPEFKIVVPPSPVAQVAAEPFQPLTPPPYAYKARAYEKSSTQIGAHQDVSGLLKVVGDVANSWKPLRLWGILILLGGLGGALYSFKNDEGYMAVALGVAACGFAFIVINGSQWWLGLLVLPGGFWLSQKMNLLNLPK